MRFLDENGRAHQKAGQENSYPAFDSISFWLMTDPVLHRFLIFFDRYDS